MLNVPGRSLTYGFVDPVPTPVQSSAITITVQSAGPGFCLVTYLADFSVPTLRPGLW